MPPSRHQNPPVLIRDYHPAELAAHHDPKGPLWFVFPILEKRITSEKKKGARSSNPDKLLILT